MAEGPAVRPDVRKSLPQLEAEWLECTKCSLGERRVHVDGSFVFGEGVPRGIMFIGEGPGVEEEKEGRPFVGTSGRLLRKLLEKLGLQEYYLTNLVSCRSCEQQKDSEGLPVLRKNQRTRQMEIAYRDEPPTPPQCMACSPRLYEEIYMVDPTVIVGLGNKACEALMGHSITITRDRGETSHIEIPGASFAPDLTDVRKEWMRNKKGVITTPTHQNTVRYHFIPTLHPAYVCRFLDDAGLDSPLRKFAADLRKAIRTHEFYRREVLGLAPTNFPEIDDTTLQREVQED